MRKLRLSFENDMVKTRYIRYFHLLPLNTEGVFYTEM